MRTATSAPTSSSGDRQESRRKRERLGDRAGDQRRRHAREQAEERDRRNRRRAETPGRAAASANPQGTMAPVPTPTIAKPSALTAKPKGRATIAIPAAATPSESEISARSLTSRAQTVRIEPQRRLASREERAAEARQSRQGAALRLRSSGADQASAAVSQAIETPTTTPSTTRERVSTLASRVAPPPTRSAPARGAAARHDRGGAEKRDRLQRPRRSRTPTR